MTALARHPSGALGSTAFRLAAAGVALFVLAAAAIVGVLFCANEQGADRAGAGDARRRGRRAVGGGPQGGLDGWRRRSPRAAALMDRLYFLSSGDGAKLAGNLNRLPPELQASPEGGVFRYARLARRTRASDLASASRSRCRAAPPSSSGGMSRSSARSRTASGGSSCSASAPWRWTGLAGGLAISRRILGRIETINAASRTIMAGDLSRRVPVDGSNDELDGLAQSLNAMLDRIEQLMNGLREVSDNIAHDLKTPLSRLRNRVEAALRDPRREPAYREGLERTLEEADELIKTFNALLLIARLEAGALEETTERFDLGALVRDVAELYEPVAEEAASASPFGRARRALDLRQPPARRPGGGEPHRQRHQVRRASRRAVPRRLRRGSRSA